MSVQRLVDAGGTPRGAMLRADGSLRLTFEDVGDLDCLVVEAAGGGQVISGAVALDDVPALITALFTWCESRGLMLDDEQVSGQPGEPR